MKSSSAPLNELSEDLQKGSFGSKVNVVSSRAPGGWNVLRRGLLIEVPDLSFIRLVGIYLAITARLAKRNGAPLQKQKASTHRGGIGPYITSAMHSIEGSDMTEEALGEVESMTAAN